MGKLDICAADDLDGLDDVIRVLLEALLEFGINGEHGGRTVGITRVYPHGIHIFYEAHSDHLILRVTDYFKF